MSFPLDYRNLGNEQGVMSNYTSCGSGGAAVLAEFLRQRDFRGQQIEALGHRVIFCPKFHCELTSVERYWCRASGLQGTIAGTTLKH